MEKQYENNECREWEKVITNIVRNSDNQCIDFPGFCNVCKKEVAFKLDDLYSGELLCFRERFICPECGLNNRQRVMVSFVCSVYPENTQMYIYEQITSSYKYLKSKFINIVGSEYLGDEYESGWINDKGIRHENALHLSFKDNTFDCLVSQDVFEHVSNIDMVLYEAYRVLKDGGNLYISIPFFTEQLNTIQRAFFLDGKIIHALEPRYHGNPVDPKNGSLVFYDYGWDLNIPGQRNRLSDD